MERLVRTRNELLTATNALIKTMKRTPSTVLSNALQANAEQISDLNRRLIAGGHETANDQIPVWNVMTTTGTIIDAFTSKRRREEQATTHRPSKRLKPEEAPKFNGTALDYPRYKAAVEDLVTENEDVADSAKARLIYDHLGEATQKRMGPFEQYSGDPAKLLQRLDETFLKGKMITNEWLLKIAQLPTLFQYGPLNGWEELTNLVIGIKDTRQLPGYESRLVDSVKDKLPAPCRHEFNKNHPDTLVGLSEYLESEVDSFRNEQLREQCKVTASRVPTSKPSQQKIPHQKKDTPWKPKSQPTFFQEKHSISGAMNSCIFCEDKHQSSNCPLAPNARYWSIRKKGICTRCLKHKWSDNKQCEGKCAFCPWPHHEWLCRDNNKQVTLPMTKQIFLSTVVARVSCNDRSVCARILLDTGAKRTIITEALTKALACRINTTTKISLSGIGGKDETTKGTVIVSVQALKGGFQRDVKLWVVPTITNIPTEMPSSQLTEFVKRRDIILTEPLSEHSEFTRSISIIIGQDCGEAFRTNTRVELGPLFSAYWTRLGWSLAGNTEDRALVALENSGCVCDDLRRLFEYGDEEPQEMSLQIRFSEVKHRYYVRLPVISLTDLDDNYGNAINQAKQLRDRLIRKNNFEEYHQVMLDYCKNDYAERVSQPMGGDPQSEDEEDSHNGKHTPWPVKYHIPHLPVYKREATKTKVRSVFNASSHRTGLKSLNQCLFKGNVSHCDLVQTLYRIRLAPILLTTDLKKAFLQVRIDPRDRDLLRYFWYEDVRDVQPKVYRMKVALFGAVCSPAILSEVVDHHMKQHQTDYPEAVNALKGGLYVDDGALAAESREQAKRIVRQTTDLFSIASFQLHDWNCSDSTLTSLPTDDVMVNCPDEFVNCLGMEWNPRQDEMRFKIDELELPVITTRRIALSMLSKLFDPLGLVMPFTILLRIFIRDLATETKDWDRKLSELQATTLRRLTSQLCCLKTITIPRHIPTELLCELHVYCDASPTALRAVAYVTGPNQDQMLLQANGKLAPRKPSTVPRLELCAAVMCVELMKKIVTKCDRVFHSTYLYSDSQVTLHRIHNNANKYNAYVARRIVKIQESVINGHQWCYVSTHNNPTDLITKGLAAKPLINSRLWCNGQRLVRDEMPHIKPPSDLVADYISERKSLETNLSD